MGYWGYGNFAPYVSVGEKIAKAERLKKKLQKSGMELHPVEEGVKLGESWWGKAWNHNLERYADYENRIGRGKAYVKNGFVIDLTIEKGAVKALVAGSSAKPYQVEVSIKPIAKETWETLKEKLGRRIDSIESLVSGSFPKDFGALLQDTLFPRPDEITFSCSCPDGAWMCKHVAAVLYGVGTRLDHDPLLFFTLRDIDTESLIKQSVEKRTKTLLANAKKQSSRELSAEDASRLFGL